MAAGGTAEGARGGVPISLEECIVRALARNYTLDIRREGQQAAGFDLEAALAAYVPTVTAGAEYAVSTGEVEVGAQEVRVDTDTGSLEAGLNGRLQTGATYSLVFNTNETAGERLGTGGGALIPFTSARATLGAIQLRQPLRRGFQTDTTRFTIEQRRLNLEAARQNLERDAMNTVNAVERGYYDLLAAYQTVGVREKALELARVTLEQTEARVAIGTLPPLGAAEARSLAASSEADLLAAVQNLRERTNTLLLLLTRNFQAWQGLLVLPGSRPALEPPVLDYRASMSNALLRRPDLALLKTSLEAEKSGLALARDQLKAQVDLVGSAGLQADEDSWGGAVGDLGGFDQPFYSVGVAVSLPWSNRRAESEASSAQSSVRQAEWRVQQQEQAILAEVDTAVSAVQANWQRTIATRQAREFAEAALAAEQEKLASGKSIPFIVLQLQRTLTNAQAEEVTAQANYFKALADLRLRDGSGLQYWNLQVQNPEPAPLDAPGTE